MTDIFEQMKNYACTLEADVNGNVQKRTMTAPRMMLEGEFMSLIQQAAQHPDPVKVTMSRIVPVYDELTGEWVQREQSITFKNNAYKND